MYVIKKRAVQLLFIGCALRITARPLSINLTVGLILIMLAVGIPLPKWVTWDMYPVAVALIFR